MSIYVVEGATLNCSNGTCPSKLVIANDHKVYLHGKKRANKTDFVGMVNIMPFGVCTVKPGPPPCVPSTLPWQITKDDVLLENSPTVTDESICICVAGGGVISVQNDGQ